MVDFRLDGKRALVTGAGGGLGRAVADGLVELGATVYGTSRDPEVARQLTERYGTPSFSLDAVDVSSIEDTVSAVQEASGGIDLLVNNAGVNRTKPAVEVTEADWDAILDTNLKGAFFLSTAFGRGWLQAGQKGAIVNIASQAGQVAIEERAPYCISKAGMIHLTKSLALEWAEAGIRVNAVAPTFIRTELTAAALARPEWGAEVLRRIPMGRVGEPDDVVGAVAFLLSDAAGLITGHTITVDGGYTIR
jgi:NAD(P)-dependent dehydrogenase (short-subunit alcohol dehydrogenase family)